MATWRVEAGLSEGPQMVTIRGVEVAVLVPIEEWRRLQASRRPTLKELLLSDEGPRDIIVPERGQTLNRALPQD